MKCPDEYANRYSDNTIDVPFDCRHQCWFCGEPYNASFTFPHSRHIVLACPHPTLSVPSCTECFAYAMKAEADDIFAVRAQVKQQLISRYRKDLAIGLNWTKEELANSGFEGGNFEGFQRSAWFMYEVAKSRVNFKAWPLSLNGVELAEQFEQSSFLFDGVVYPTINDAIIHYCRVFDIKPTLLTKALAKVGIEQFAYAVRFSRLLVGATPDEIRVALNQLP